MDDCCQFIDECPVYSLLHDPSRRALLDGYCLENFGKCQRRQLVMAGQYAPPDMLPMGTFMLPPDERVKTIL